MASQKIPLSVAAKQQALFVKPLPPAELVALGRKYEEAGQYHDALDFYQAAKDRDSLNRLADAAVEEADLVLLLNACRALGEETSRSKIESLQRRAQERGLESVVKRAATFLAQNA
jgi:tetratricopeptide (TPR) repeat protein